MRRVLFLILSIYFINQPGISQEKENTESRILFHGVVMDASTLSPLANTQIVINRTFTSVSKTRGDFLFYVNRKDTVVFSCLGYKQIILYVSDTLTGREFNAGIYMHTDTLLIGEVVIIPRFINLKSEILNSRSKNSVMMDNARYNVAISAYQGRNSQNTLGDPSANYELLRHKQRVDAYERGGIPSDKMVGLSPLLLIPAAYLLIHGLPEKPPDFEPQLTDYDIAQIQKKYLETRKKR